jgi:hypothetical protein
MAVDVSVYNEIARSTVSLAQCVTNAYGPCYALGFANGVSAATTINNGGTTCQAVIYPIRLACNLIAQPWCCCYWAAIPTLPSVTAGLLVCDTSFARCGVCCAWTVPGGAQFVRFLMWGAGALSQSSVCCCGISIPGSSGAYASVIIPAVPGCVYTLCAGCAACCYADYNNAVSTGSGCSSFVNGYGLNNVCAEGGEVSPFCWIKRKFAVNGVDDSGWPYCMFLPNPSWVTAIKSLGSFCMCSNGGFCNGGSIGVCTWSGCHCFITSCKTFRGNVTNATQCCHFVIGTPGVWASLSGLTTSFSNCVNFPPVTCYSSCTPVQCYLNSCISPGLTCNMCSLYTNPCQRPDNAPGRGGGGSMSSGGNAQQNGFPGNGGAICVQYL